MGMFDYITCDYPLPDLPKFVESNHLFQTKSLDCLMDNYHISSEGKLLAFPSETLSNILKINPDPTRIDYTGVINFYTSNLTGAGPGIYTKNGEDAEDVEYSAKIVDGEVKEIKKTHYNRRPALKQESIKPYILTEEEEDKKKKERTLSEDLTGKSVYVLWGGKENGYWAKVVHSGKKEHCIESDDHGLEKLHRFQRNIIFFDTEEEAFSYRDNRKKSWQDRKEIYDIYAAKRQLEIDKESKIM